MVRSLVLGLVLGFSAASVVSCGAGKKSCGPSTCNGGCCDANGDCQPGTSPLSCGTLGQGCAMCSANTTCSLGQCKSLGGTGGSTGGNGGSTGGSGGATGGSGGQTGGASGGGSADPCASGCFNPITQQCQVGNLPERCGAPGTTCTDCTLTGGTCQSLRCTGGQGGSGGSGGSGGAGGSGATIGSPCVTTSQCAALGSSAYCKLTTQPESGFTSYTYPEGFCTVPCTGTCTSGVCAGGPRSILNWYNEKARFCVRSCSNTSACTDVADQDCVRVNSLTATPQKGCWLSGNASSFPPFTGGGTPTRLGQACSSDSTCINPPDELLGFCATSFPGGYCMADATYADSSAWCGAAGIGVELPQPDGGTFPVCLQRCTVGQAVARSGYACVPTNTSAGAVYRSLCSVPGDCATIDPQLNDCRQGVCCIADGGCISLTTF